MQKEEVMTIGSDNVFEDIDYPRPKEALAKAKLIHRIRTIIKNRGLKRKDRKEVAKLLHISPKALSVWDDLLDGHLDEFTVGQLMDYLAALKNDTEIIVRDAYRPVQFRVAAG